MGGHLIPDSWALPIAALAIGASDEEAQKMVDDGIIDLADHRTVDREALRRQIARLKEIEGFFSA